ncbi:MAG: flagellin FliC [Deltaproteobacteria bacterium]|nr:flagellin FliC [Deltaproteobacteria bacterium]HCH64133.1 flagellin FliC [Deltaproteobacteria bacterium]
MITLNSNPAALGIGHAMAKNTKNLTGSLQRVSSGKRVNRAADDAASLGVSSTLGSQSRGLRMAMRNANDGISIIQAAETANSSAIDMLQRMRSLAIQSSSETLDSGSRAFAQEEFLELRNQVKTLAIATEFNGIFLTDNSAPTISVQVGANDTSNDRIDIQLTNLRGVVLTLGGASVSTTTNASSAIDTIDTALSDVNSGRSVLGAAHTRLLASLSVGETSATALTSAESQIIDADYATESSALTKHQILRSAGIASLSQARNIHRSVVALI